MPVVGFLSARSPEESAALLTAFHQGLSEDGHVEGRNVAIEYRWAGGHFDQLPALTAELLRRRVSVVVAVTTPAALAAKAATGIIPFVLVAGGDPLSLRSGAWLDGPG